MLPIDRTDIEVWGKRQETKGEFPLFLSKLIFETTPRSTIFDIPSGSAVFIEGWDGIVSCQENTNFVPQGISLWELKTNGGKKQADQDYEKRVKDSLGFPKSDVTFIFVTSKTWKGKRTWADDRKKESVWKDVLVYDARDLATWINITEISIGWLSEQLGRSSNYLTAEEFWENWSVGPKNGITHITLTPKVVTAGRENESQKLIEFLHGDPNIMAVRGSTKDEAIAFIIGSVKLSSEQFYAQFESRSVVLENLQGFREAKKSKHNLNLIAKFDDTNELHSAVARYHHVLLPLGPDDQYTSQDIIALPILEKKGQVEALISSGLSEEDANKYSKEAARDISILKRLIGFKLSRVKWEKTKNIYEIIPALLIGRWDETKNGDIKILERFSGMQYDSYVQKLESWLEVESTPIMKIGSSWRLTSQLDAWNNLAPYVTDNDFTDLREGFLKVMKEINPVFELEPRKRIMASVLGKESIYSSWCREGLTQSLILISLYGENLKLQGAYSSEEWVSEIIEELLYEAPGKLWASRNLEMPLIAEASPDTFLKCVYHSLSLESKPIMDMFIEEQTMWTPESNHTGLLWALEGLAWEEDYLLKSSLILARLAALDPGGKLVNRPINSLREIFKPWHYQTLASFDIRMAALEQIITKQFEIGWSLLIGMIPKNRSGTAFPTHKMRWRLFNRSYDTKYYYDEIFSTHTRVLELLIKYYDYSEYKLIDLLKASASVQVHNRDREEIFSFIETNIEKVKIEDNSAWQSLRKILASHRSYPDAPWALSEKQLGNYEKLYHLLEPKDIIDQVVWMFSDPYLRIPEGTKKNELSFEERAELVVEKRIGGVKEIYKEKGFDAVLELVQIVKEVGIYGDIVARIIEGEEKIKVLCHWYLIEEKGPGLTFIQSFIFRKSILNGIDWVFKWFELLEKDGLHKHVLAKMFYHLLQTKKLWDYIDNTEDEVKELYWINMSPQFWNLSVDDTIYGIHKLMEVKRFLSAVDIAYHKVEELPTSILIEVLEKTISIESIETRLFDGYHASYIFAEIEKRGDFKRKSFFTLEWLYLSFLLSHDSIYKPKLLHKELANNPAFFVEVLELAYKSDSKSENQNVEISDEIRNRSIHAYDLLKSWKQIPGANTEGKIDKKSLWNWIDYVREKAKESGRLDVADSEIGKVLAAFPEKEEPWPPIEICEVIETIDTRSLKSSFSSATFNKRGFSTRGVYDGGIIERKHAEYFHVQSKSLEIEYPKTSEILKRLALGYERDARRMDEAAKKDMLDH
ncbi:MAG: hypothetical protein RIM83_17995 [Allomuricauda sp.]